MVMKEEIAARVVDPSNVVVVVDVVDDAEVVDEVYNVAVVVDVDVEVVFSSKVEVAINQPWEQSEEEGTYTSEISLCKPCWVVFGSNGICSPLHKAGHQDERGEDGCRVVEDKGNTSHEVGHHEGPYCFGAYVEDKMLHTKVE